MKFSAMVLAAAIGASAHPSGHAHRNAHRSLEAREEFYMATKPAPPMPDSMKKPSNPPAPPPKPKAKPSPPPKPKAKPAPPPPKQNAAQSVKTNKIPQNKPSSGGHKKFCHGKRYEKRATLGQIAYQGNLGTAEDYACNLMMVDSAAGYDYTATFINKAGSDQKCSCWLKIGPDGHSINGFFADNQALDFDLPAGGQKVLAADSNSQGGCCCGSGGCPLTNIKQFAGTWFEFDWANESNGGASGADASCLVAGAAGLSIPAMSVCDEKTCSTVKAGGHGTNAYFPGMEAEDGVGINRMPGPAHFKVTVG